MEIHSGREGSLQGPDPVPDFSKADLEGLSFYLFAFDFSPCLSSSDIEYEWAFISDAIYSGFDFFIPSIRLPTKSFLNGSLLTFIHDCKCLCKLKRSRSSWRLSVYKLSKLGSFSKAGDSTTTRSRHSHDHETTRVLYNKLHKQLDRIFALRCFDGRIYVKNFLLLINSYNKYMIHQYARDV